MNKGDAGKVRSEGRDYLTNDMVVNLSENFDHRFTFNQRRSLGERYSDGRIEVHVHFLARVDGSHRESRYFCATFYKSFMDANDARADSRVADIVGTQGHPTEGCNGRVEEAMSIEPRKLVELPQGGIHEGVASLVRLQSLNSCFRAWRHATNAPRCSLAEHTRSHTSLSLPIYVPEDREFNLIRGLFGEGVGVRGGELVGQEVETRTEVVKAISNNTRKDARVGGVDLLNVDDVLAGCAIEIMDNEMVITISPARGLTFQFLQVVERPRKG